MEWSDWEIGRCVCDIVNEVNKIVNEVNKIVNGMNKVVGKVNKARSMCLGRKKVLEDVKANQKDRWLRCILTTCFPETVFANGTSFATVVQPLLMN